MSPRTKKGGGRWIVATVAVVSVAVGASVLGPRVPGIGGGSGGGALTKNIWVGPGGSCADSVSPVVYASAISCATLPAAYAIADPGDNIGWHTGTYSGGVVAQNASLRNLSPGCNPLGEPELGATSSVNCVTVEPDGPITVNGIMEIRGSSLYIKGTATGTWPSTTSRSFNINLTGYMDVEANSNSDYPDHVTVRGVKALSIGTFNAEDIVFKDIEQGPAWTTAVGTGNCFVQQGNGFENKVGEGGSTTKTPTRVVWDSVYIHDNTRTVAGRDGDGGSGCHWGALFLVTVDGFTLRNSVFSKNWVYNIQVQQCCGALVYPKNVLIENNWFGVDVKDIFEGGGIEGQSDIQFDNGTATNWLIRYNSFSTDTGGNGGSGCYATPCTYSNVRFVGNTGNRPANGSTDPCGATGVTMTYNAWVGGTCGTGDQSISATSLFTTTTLGSENFHLGAGTAPDNLVTPTSADYTLTTDIDSQSRTAGSRDAGSDER